MGGLLILNLHHVSKSLSVSLLLNPGMEVKKTASGQISWRDFSTSADGRGARPEPWHEETGILQLSPRRPLSTISRSVSGSTCSWELALHSQASLVVSVNPIFTAISILNNRAATWLQTSPSLKDNKYFACVICGNLPVYVVYIAVNKQHCMHSNSVK